MKKTIAFVLSAVLAFALICTCSFAEEPEEKNHLTHKWEATLFPGTLTETVEDGDTVTTYKPQYEMNWFSPQISILDDLKTMAGDKDTIEFYFTCELRGVFNNPSDVNTFKFLIRALDPKTGGCSFSADEMEDWDGKGNSWMDIFYDVIGNGDFYFVTDSGVNVMAYLNPSSVEVTADEWTVFESDTIEIPTALLSSGLFKDLIICMDFAPSGFSDMKSIQVKNTAIREVSAAPVNTATPEPEEDDTADPGEPTDVPEDPTDDPAGPTDVPEGPTSAPEGPTAAPEDPEPTATPKDNKGCGGVLTETAAVMVAAAAAVMMPRSKKEK